MYIEPVDTIPNKIDIIHFFAPAVFPRYLDADFGVTYLFVNTIIPKTRNKIGISLTKMLIENLKEL